MDALYRKIGKAASPAMVREMVRRVREVLHPLHIHQSGELAMVLLAVAATETQAASITPVTACQLVAEIYGNEFASADTDDDEGEGSSAGSGEHATTRPCRDALMLTVVRVLRESAGLREVWQAWDQDQRNRVRRALTVEFGLLIGKACAGLCEQMPDPDSETIH
jgi:hypothetical protein